MKLKGLYIKRKYHRKVKSTSFIPSEDVLKILKSIPDGERTLYINWAIKQYAEKHPIERESLWQK